MENRTVVFDKHCQALRIGDAGLAEIFAVTGKSEAKFAKRFTVTAIGQEEYMPTITLTDDAGNSYKKHACWFVFVTREGVRKIVTGGGF